MSKTDTAAALGVLGLFALVGYWGAKKAGLIDSKEEGAPSASILDSLKNFFAGTAQGPVTVQDLPGTGAAYTPEPRGYSADLESQVAKNVKLVFEYLQRHPAENVANYYQQYPETAWIRPYAFPELSNLQPVSAAPARQYNAYSAWQYIGGSGYEFGGRSSDSIIQQALGAGWVPVYV